ncbi:MAG TPA: galactokinase family protein [Gemmatimonadaceae bacterium]|nr:galactokinase family protein [Gemmatimonadaceae bacterium]
MGAPREWPESNTFALLERELAAFGAGGAGAAPMAFRVPGRIEVLGKHTDYGGGRSLLCAVDRGIAALVRPRRADAPNAALVRMRDAKLGVAAEFALSADTPPTPGSWSNYPITVARGIAANFGGPLRGADIAFWSDIPHAAGVSSSSALVVTTFLALGAVNRLEERPAYRAAIHDTDGLAGYLGAVENGLDFGALRGNAGVGTFGGSEDHTAILSARPGAVAQYRFCPVTFERAIPLPPGVTFVVGASGVQAEKTGPALHRYNDVSRRLSTALDCWRRSTGRTDPSMGTALASAPDARARLLAVLGETRGAAYPPESLVERVAQFDDETNHIIPAAGDALARGDLATFGAQVARSQAGAERALHNQIPETIALVRLALDMGAAAASAFGAGFGGSVWALVDTSHADEFCRRWGDAYRAAFPAAAPRAEFFVTRAGPPAARLA